MAEVELKRCPFCGSNAQLNEYHGHKSAHFVARCVACEAQIYNTDKAKAIEAWNRGMTMKYRIKQLAKIFRHTKDQELKNRAFAVSLWWLAKRYV